MGVKCTMLYPDSFATFNFDLHEENGPKHFAKTDIVCNDSKGISSFPATKSGSTLI